MGIQIYFVIRILLGVINYYILSYFWEHFLVSRRFGRTKFLILLACSAAMSSVNLLAIPIVNTIASLTVNFIIVHLCFKGKLASKIFLSLAALALMLVMEIIGMVLVMFFSKENWMAISQSTDYSLVLSVTGYIFAFAFIKLITHICPGIRKKEPLHQSAYLLLFPTMSMISMYMLVSASFEFSAEPTGAWLLLLFAGAQLCASIIVFKAYENSLLQSELRHKLRSAELIAQAEISYNQYKEYNEDVLRRQQHDVKNMLFSLKEMLPGDTGYATEYVDNFLRSMEHQDLGITAELCNKQVNFILNKYKGICAKKGIAFRLQLEYDNLAFINFIDTSTFLENALSNAVEGCETVPEGEERWIRIRIFRYMNEVLLGVQNTKRNRIAVDDKGRLVSTKGDPVSHGHGYHNMCSSAARYGGQVAYEDTATTFRVMIVLPIPGEDGQEPS